MKRADASILDALEGGRSTQSGATARTDAALVVMEAAFATILVVGAGLLLRTFWTCYTSIPAFVPNRSSRQCLAPIATSPPQLKEPSRSTGK